MRNTVMDPIGMSMSPYLKKGPDFSCPFSNLRGTEIDGRCLANLNHKTRLMGSIKRFASRANGRILRIRIRFYHLDKDEC